MPNISGREGCYSVSMVHDLQSTGFANDADESKRGKAQYMSEDYCHDECYDCAIVLDSVLMSAPRIHLSSSMDMLNASVSGCAHSILKLAARGIDVNTHLANGCFPITITTRLGHVEAVKSLLIAGADIEVADDNDNTPLCIAAIEGHLEVITLLAENGANVNATGMCNWTPIMIAAKLGLHDVIMKLVHYGGDVDMSGGNGETAIELAVTSLDIDTTIFLVNLGANLSTYLELVAPTNHIHDMIHNFGKQLAGVKKHCETSRTHHILSVTKLMMSVHLSAHFNENRNLSEKEMLKLENDIALSFAKSKTSNLMNQISYDIRRRFIQIAEKLYNATFSKSECCISDSSKAKRYVDLVHFLFDEAMMRDVLSLRLICRICCTKGVFPVHSMCRYHEFECDMFECYIANESSCFVPTQDIQEVMNIHSLLKL